MCDRLIREETSWRPAIGPVKPGSPRMTPEEDQEYKEYEYIMRQHALDKLTELSQELGMGYD